MAIDDEDSFGDEYQMNNSLTSRYSFDREAYLSYRCFQNLRQQEIMNRNAYDQSKDDYAYDRYRFDMANHLRYDTAYRCCQNPRQQDIMNRNRNRNAYDKGRGE